MLKPNASEDQSRTASEQSRKLGATGYFFSLAAIYALFDLRHGTIPEFDWRDFILLFPMLGVSLVLSQVLWWIAAGWVGRFDPVRTLDAMKDPRAYPKTLNRFMNAWADNELLLGILHVLLIVVISLAFYRLLGPSLGIL